MSALSLWKQPFHLCFSQSRLESTVRCATAFADWYAPSPTGSSGSKARKCTFTVALKLATTGLCVDAIGRGAECTKAVAAAALFVLAARTEEFVACFLAMTNGIAVFVATEATTADFAVALNGFLASVTLEGVDFVTFAMFDATPLARTNDNMIPVVCFIVYLSVT
mmetsp:Transcript_133601/g.260155  ORF Transcript_133601/g.260155 Transcript_133601/m.260155 type:complete len:166 (-) Transcript_133601:52-549(-)